MSNRSLLLWHVFGLSLLLINTVARFFDVRVIAGLVTVMLFIVWFSAAVLFFRNRKPFKWMSVYFSLAIVIPIAFVVAWRVDELSGYSLAYVFMATTGITSLSTEFSSNNYYVYPGMSGFIDECCWHDVYERRLFFERRVESVNISPADSLSFQEGEASLKFFIWRKNKTMEYKIDSLIIDLTKR